MKKLAIFDFDGTLFDSFDDVMICLDETLRAHDFPTLTRQGYIESVGGNIDDIMSKVLKDNSTPENIELIKKTYESLYDASEKENTKPYPGIHELLEKLEQNNIILAINSNRSTDSIRYFVEKHLSGIDFLEIEGHNPPHPSKPNSYGVDKIIKKASADFDEAIYIGDSKTDIKTAKNAGIECVIVKWGYGNQKDYDDDYILGNVENPSEIIGYFNI